jgi:hypothetical protein
MPLRVLLWLDRNPCGRSYELHSRKGKVIFTGAHKPALAEILPFGDLRSFIGLAMAMDDHSRKKGKGLWDKFPARSRTPFLRGSLAARRERNLL